MCMYHQFVNMEISVTMGKSLLWTPFPSPDPLCNKREASSDETGEGYDTCNSGGVLTAAS